MLKSTYFLRQTPPEQRERVAGLAAFFVREQAPEVQPVALRAATATRATCTRLVREQAPDLQVAPVRAVATRD